MLPRKQFSMTWLVVVSFFACPSYARSGEKRPPTEFVGDLLGTGSELDALPVFVLPEGAVNGDWLSLRMPQLSQ